jgi:uncharacterized membrane protein (DUF2068 family)
MTTDEAFEHMIPTRGIYHKLGLAKGTVGKMRNDLKTGNAKILIDRKIALLQKAGYKLKQEIVWKKASRARRIKKTTINV